MMRTQKGMTIIEALGALAVASLLLVGMSSMVSASLDESKGEQAALHQQQLAAAAAKYIAAKHAALAGGAFTSVTVAQLKAAGLLSDAFAATNAYQQSACVLVKPDNRGHVDALVVTYGGTAIPERDLAQVAMQAGQGGGYIGSAAPGSARGSTWELATTTWRGLPCGGAGTAVLSGKDAGHLVSQLLFNSAGQLTPDFLTRDAVPGQEAANRMSAPLHMAALAVENDATDARCTPTEGSGRIAAAADGRLLSCQAGVWKRQGARYWREPVAAYADLPASGQAGDVRMVTTLARAFAWNGAGWSALGVDQDGKLLVPQTVTSARIKVNQTVTADAPCSANGSVARDASGLALSCQDGVWRNPLAFRLNALVYDQAWTVHVNDGTAMDTYIDLTALPGPRPLYITGYALCHATGFPRAYAYVNMHDPAGPGFMVGGCMSRPDDFGNGVLNSGRFGLQEIPENVTMLHVHREVEPDGHCVPTCLAGPNDYIQLAIKIYNSQ